MDISGMVLQGGGVMSFTYYIIEMIKDFVPVEAKKFIPFMAILIAGTINSLITPQDPLGGFIAGAILGLSTSKTYDIKEAIKTSQDTNNEKQTDEEVDLFVTPITNENK